MAGGAESVQLEERCVGKQMGVAAFLHVRYKYPAARPPCWGFLASWVWRSRCRRRALLGAAEGGQGTAQILVS